MRPGPLSAAAVAELVRARLGEDADERFCAACARVTGGNPLLLRQLLSSLEADGVKPDAAHVDVVADIGPRAVSRTVLLRLARLPDEAVSVARAVAVLGESADLPAVAALAEIPEQQVADASGALARAEILGSGSPLGFVHPLVREAIYQELSAGQRELMHARAATILREAGAQPDQVASHLLSMARRGQEWVVELLVEAARSAVRRSAPESAVAYLTRALEEPPAPERRGEILLDLGISGTNTYAPLALEHLREAYELLEDPRKRATRGLPPGAHADLRRQPRRRGGLRAARARRAAAGPRRRAQGSRGGRAGLGELRRGRDGRAGAARGTAQRARRRRRRARGCWRRWSRSRGWSTGGLPPAQRSWR